MIILLIIILLLQLQPTSPLPTNDTATATATTTTILPQSTSSSSTNTKPTTKKSTSQPTTSDKKNKPNIIIYLADDLGYGEANQQTNNLGFPYDIFKNLYERPTPAERIIKTPNLARLATQSVRLLNNHSPSAVCAPSRSALWLGRSVGFNRIRSNSNPKDGVGELMCNSPDWIPWPKFIQQAGYDTYFLGKWGLGSTTGHPRKCGFSFFQGYSIHGGAIGLLPFPPTISLFNVSTWNPSSMKDMDYINFPENTQYKTHPLNENYCSVSDPNTKTGLATSVCSNMDDAIFSKAMTIISNYKNPSIKTKPFFLVWAPLTPHASRWYFAPGTRLSFAPINTSPVVNLGLRTRDRFPTWKLCERGHAAQIEYSIDRDIDHLLDLLESSPTLNKNTLFIFTSDNGPHRECDPVAIHDTPKFFMGAGGLLGHKTTMWEGGLRVPTMVRWVGTIPGGTVSRIPSTSIDFIPSIFEAIGISPTTQKYNASSLLQAWILGDEKSKFSRINNGDNRYFQTEICRDPFQDSSCVTSTYDTGDWPNTLYKFIRHELNPQDRLENGNPPLYELFELVSDPQETTSLIGNPQYRKMIKEFLNIRQELRLPHPSDDWIGNSINLYA
jgi:arylsulfatase A